MIRSLLHRFASSFVIQAIIFSLVVAGIHSSQLLLSATDFADANDLLLASYFGSLAHPPGYPLLIHLIRLGHFVIPWAPINVVAAGLSALCMSATSGMVYWCLTRWLRAKTSNQKVWLPALIITTIWSFMSLHWLLGSVVEIMPLGLLLLLAMTVCFIGHRWWGVGFFGTLAGLYHPLLLGTVGVALVIMWQQKRFSWRWAVGVVCGGGLTLVAYWQLASGSSTYSWELPQAWWQWIGWWFRTVYTREGSAIEQFNVGAQFVPGLVAIGKWTIWWMVDQCGWLLLLPAIFGSVSLIRKRYKKEVLVWLSLTVIYGPVLAFYVKHPSLYTGSETAIWWGIALRERMFYVISLCLLPLSAWGIAMMCRRKFIGILLLIGSIGFAQYQIGRGSMIKEVNASTVYATKLLQSLPHNAVCVVDADEVFQLLYVQLINGVRSDIVIVPTGIVLEPQQWEKLRGSMYLNDARDDMKRYVADIVSTSLLRGYRVFVYNMDPTILTYLGLEGNPFYAMPYGWTIELSRSPITQAETFDYGFSVQLASLKTEHADAWFKGFRTHLATIHTQQAYYYARLGYTTLAQWHQSIAKELFYADQSRQVVDQSVIQGTQMAQQLNSYAAYTPLSTEQWLARSLEAQQKMDWKAATYFMSRAVLTNMSRIDLHQQLIALYRKSGNESEANKEQQWLATYQP